MCVVGLANGCQPATAFHAWRWVVGHQVTFFARVIGYLHKEPVSQLLFGFYLNALSFLVNELQTTNQRWVTTTSGTTWIPKSVCIACIRKLQGRSAKALSIAERMLSKLKHMPEVCYGYMPSARSPHAPRWQHINPIYFPNVDACSWHGCGVWQHQHENAGGRGRDAAVQVECVDLDEFLHAMTTVSDLFLASGNLRRVGSSVACFVQCGAMHDLGATTQSYQAVEDTLVSEWDVVYYDVDEDRNGVLDSDEFLEVRSMQWCKSQHCTVLICTTMVVRFAFLTCKLGRPWHHKQAVRRIPELRVPPYLARKVFMETCADQQDDFIDLATFRQVSAPPVTCDRCPTSVHRIDP